MPDSQKKRHDTDRDETAGPQDAADIELQPGVGTAGDATRGGGDPASKADNAQEERDSRQDAR